MDYQPLPHAKGNLFTGTLNGVGKGLHEIFTVVDSGIHDVIDPNNPTPLPTGPMRRTRRNIGNTLGNVFSRKIFQKPIRTLGTAAYSTIFELPQNALFDIPETLSGNTNNQLHSLQSNPSIRAIEPIHSSTRNRTSTTLQAA